MGVPYTPEQLKKLGLIEVNGTLVKASSQVAKNVKKIEPGVRFGLGVEPTQELPHVAIKKFIHTEFDKIKPSGNKKIKNAVKSEVDGVKFDSNLEKYMYGLLKASGITFEFQVEYLLQEKFRYGTEAIRAITLTVDFKLPTRNMIIDTKGYANDRAPMKYKMLKLFLFKECERTGCDLPTIETPSNKKECDLLLNRLLYGK